MTDNTVDHTIDPAVAEAVQSISNRFGVAGLEEMIAAAQAELERSRAALRELSVEEGGPAGS